ncbi:hypothetical protein [Propylenella binzhouense]|uniref:Uncharacterized protein n=1 Tax=Propylenella binzhouense TaxID=2555902 RepID=A0A964T2L1_9HYPH|nr:hypothetical protein [Propylenella binzhouense]MYZ47336.1 hypothetical protein [Propylenella binzhouense]
MNTFSGWSDEEFDRRMATLDEVLCRHLGPQPDPNAENAEALMMALWLPAGGSGAMNQRQEREHLAEVQKCARALTKAWKILHSDIRARMEIHSYSMHKIEDESGRGLYSENPLSLTIVGVLDLIIDAMSQVGNEVIDAAPSLGRRDFVSVGIVERLRTIWAERKGTPAPKSMTEAGPFADLVIDVFDALGLEGNPRAAVDSWREFRVKNQIV